MSAALHRVFLRRCASWAPCTADGALHTAFAGKNTLQFMPRIKGLLVDAAGTLLWPVEPAAEVYLRFARRYGCTYSADEVLQRFRCAYGTPWGHSTIRYVGDGRPFWRHIVQASTGCCNEEMFEAVYEYYARHASRARRLALPAECFFELCVGPASPPAPESKRRGDSYMVAPDAVESLQRIRARGIQTAVVSNFDTRLHRILRELGVHHLWDAVICSADWGAEKPNPVLFQAAFQALGLPPDRCLHVGDDRRNDVHGARDSGCFALLWGQDVASFSEVERRIATGNLYDSLDDA